MSHNGWSNYETWVVNLWLDNEQGSHEYWREVARDLYQQEVENYSAGQPLSVQEETMSSLSTALKENHEENMPTSNADVYADLLGAAMSEVDWFEIAKHFVDDIEKCECTDPGCGCGGKCHGLGEYRLYRIDMEDKTGTGMCDSCSDDASDSGVFRVEAMAL